jgi:hypothetical protein
MRKTEASLFGAAVAVILLGSATVRADDAGGNLLGVDLRAAAEQSRTSRRAVVLTGILAGAVMVPVGLALWHRSDAVSQSIGSGMTIGGAAPMVFSALSLSPTRIERLDARYERQLGWRQGASLDRETEAEWADLVDGAREARIARGCVGIALGTLATAAGAGLLLADPIHGLTRNQQYTVGAIAVGAGVPVLAIGVRAMLQLSPEETWWAAYRGERAARVEPPEGGASIPELQILPLRGGAIAGMSMSL